MSENGYTNGNGNGGGELTGLQRAFVDQWFECRFNGTEAAARAGYQGDRNVLANIASRNLRLSKVRAAIEERWAEHGVTQGEVIARLASWMRFDISELFDEHGRLVWSKVREHGDIVKEIEWDRGNKIKVKLEDRLGAAREIGKHLFLDRAEESGEGLTIIVDF